jgi:hypothetical protein
MVSGRVFCAPARHLDSLARREWMPASIKESNKAKCMHGGVCRDPAPAGARTAPRCSSQLQSAADALAAARGCGVGVGGGGGVGLCERGAGAAAVPQALVLVLRGAGAGAAGGAAASPLAARPYPPEPPLQVVGLAL